MATAIAESTISALKLYAHVRSKLAVANVAQEDPSFLNLWSDQLGRLRLWAANIGAHQRGQSSLEFRLRDASHIRDQIIRLLHDLSEALREVDDILDEVEAAEEVLADSTSVQEEDPVTELQQIHQNVVTIVGCLFQMSILVRKPARHDFIKVPSSREVSAFQPYDIDHVRNKFPKAQEGMVERLGLAMTHRRQYLRYRERHHAKLSRGLGAAEATGEAHTETASTYMSETIATDFEQPQDREDKGSEAGTSQTSLVSTVLLDGNIMMPALPAESLSGHPFECPYCYVVISVDGSRAWNKHVFEDLQPYICIVKDCSTPTALYSTRREWAQHMKQAHPGSWTFQNNPSSQGSHNCACTTLAQCCLCDYGSDSENQLIRHIAGHLQELALFVLPRTEYQSERSEESDESDSSVSYPRSGISYNEVAGLSDSDVARNRSPSLRPDWQDNEAKDPRHISPSPDSHSETRVKALPKGILKPSRAEFPEMPYAMHEIVRQPDAAKKGIPLEARWTKINRRLVNPEALEQESIRFEEYSDYVIVKKVLSQEDIARLRQRTHEIREQRRLVQWS